MSGSSAPLVGLPLWIVHRGSWFLAVLITASVALPVIAAIGDLDHSFPAPPPRTQDPLMAICAGLAIWVLQMRHSLAAARGVRPTAWPLSLLALVALAGVPWWWYSVNWITALWFPLATAAMVIRGRGAWLLAAVAMIVQGVVAAWATLSSGGGALDTTILALYNAIFLGFGVGALYWSALLVGRIGELLETRVDLALTAVSGERRRLSRDLHDQLGQSLSAISLKGDLALRLLPTRPEDAVREVDDITAVARQALMDVQAIARGEYEVSLRSEVDRAVKLLEAGGVSVRTRLDLLGLPEAVDELYAWAVREATTNVLRHSQAQRCWLIGQTTDGRTRMEIVNDGAIGSSAPFAADGSGLMGLAERARALRGHIDAQHTRGRFRLVVEVPT